MLMLQQRRARHETPASVLIPNEEFSVSVLISGVEVPKYVSPQPDAASNVKLESLGVKVPPSTPLPPFPPPPN